MFKPTTRSKVSFENEVGQTPVEVRVWRRTWENHSVRARGSASGRFGYRRIKLPNPSARNILPSKFHNINFSLVKSGTHKLPCFIFSALLVNTKIIAFTYWCLSLVSLYENASVMMDCFINAANKHLLNGCEVKNAKIQGLVRKMQWTGKHSRLVVHGGYSIFNSNVIEYWIRKAWAQMAKTLDI